MTVAANAIARPVKLPYGARSWVRHPSQALRRAARPGDRVRGLDRRAPHPAARTRTAVVDALLTLNARGHLRPTARDIAAEAGVSLRSVYVHFDDLEALFVESSPPPRRAAGRTLPPIVDEGTFDRAARRLPRPAASSTSSPRRPAGGAVARAVLARAPAGAGQRAPGAARRGRLLVRPESSPPSTATRCRCCGRSTSPPAP